MLAGSMAGYAVMMKQQHGAERRMEEAMAESITSTITCRRDEETEPCSSRARLPCFTCCRHFSSLIIIIRYLTLQLSATPRRQHQDRDRSEGASFSELSNRRASTSDFSQEQAQATDATTTHLNLTIYVPPH